MDKELRLTSFSSSGGWAGKASIEVLDRVLGQINNRKSSEKILIEGAISNAPGTCMVLYSTEFDLSTSTAPSNKFWVIFL